MISAIFTVYERSQEPRGAQFVVSVFGHSSEIHARARENGLPRGDMPRGEAPKLFSEIFMPQSALCALACVLSVQPASHAVHTKAALCPRNMSPRCADLATGEKVLRHTNNGCKEKVLHFQGFTNHVRFKVA